MSTINRHDDIDDGLAPVREVLKRERGGHRAKLDSLQRRLVEMLCSGKFTSSERSALTVLKLQDGRCAACGLPLASEIELDSTFAMDGYTVEKARLVHPEC